MGLNQSKGNMYDFVTHTWNTVKGACFHDCSYCYMKRWGKLNPVRFDEKELSTDLGKGNFIFVGSSCDMWAEDIPDEWINKTIEHCLKFDNHYLLQSKNPYRFAEYTKHKNFSFCTTIETNRVYEDIMNKSPKTSVRAWNMPEDNYVTIEPIMDFDIERMTEIIKIAKPKQVNIGADSGKHNLPEPSKEKVLNLIEELEKFTTVKLKKNINRIII